MNKRFFFLILPALLLSACASDSTSGTAGGKVTASIESMTRTQLSPEEDGYKVLWMAGDRIAVSGTATAYYTADQGGSSASAFSPEGGANPGTGPYTAWYPASLAEGSLPAVQTYTPGSIVETPMHRRVSPACQSTVRRDKEDQALSRTCRTLRLPHHQSSDR